MMFIHATKADLKDCVPCAKAFHEVYDPGVEFCEKSFIDYWEAMLDSGKGFLILIEHKDGDIIGGAGGVVVNFQTSAILNSVEMFYWVEPEFRGNVGLRLLREFEEESVRMGAKRIVMACMELSSPDRYEKLYTSRGYKRFERHFIKDVA